MVVMVSVASISFKYFKCYFLLLRSLVFSVGSDVSDKIRQIFVVTVNRAMKHSLTSLHLQLQVFTINILWIGR